MKACVLSVSGPELLPGEARLLRQEDPWGVILMGRSCVSRAQVRRLISDIHDALGRDALIFIDQEGGRVARLKAPEWPRWPAPRLYGDLYARDAEAGIRASYLAHRLMAHELRDIGITADFAPVLDVPVEGANDVIGDRAFSRNADTVIALGRAAFLGLHEGGVIGALKHMPGHGRAEADTHHDLPRVTVGRDTLENDFRPFRALADKAPVALTAHILFEAIDPDLPATLSRRVINDVIRNDIGFGGVLMTDDLGMNALGGSLGSRAARAAEAGCDVILHCSGFVKDPELLIEEMNEVASAVPHLRGEALERAGHAEDFALDPHEPFDAQASWAEFQALIASHQGVS